MRTMLSNMKKKKYGIPKDILNIFERIAQKYYVPNGGSNEGDNKFREAINEHLTEEQRFRLWEDYGACRGTGHDKERKAFAAEHADKYLPERLELYINTLGKKLSPKTRNIVLNKENNTIIVTFICDECYRKIPKEKFSSAPVLYYEACAGGRLYYLEKALGIKLRIKEIEVSPLGVSIENPCVFTFEIVE